MAAAMFMAFSFVGAHRRQWLDCPSPRSTACLVPTWTFAALLTALPLSDSACSEDTFCPTSSQSYKRHWKWRRLEGRGITVS